MKSDVPSVRIIPLKWNLFLQKILLGSIRLCPQQASTLVPFYRIKLIAISLGSGAGMEVYRCKPKEN